MLHTETVAGTTLELLKKLEAEKRMSVCPGGLFRDIPKIIKFKATNSLRVSCLFCIFKHSPQKTV
jgi:hypothetical protein